MVAATTTATVLALVVGLRAIWLGVATAHAVRALPLTPVPPALVAATRRAGAPTPRCPASTAGVAFCAGLVRPRSYVSLGAVQRLSDDELDAVVAHEWAHARRRDPLRAVLGRACRDVLFFAPLVGWWWGRHRLRAELAADRAAVAQAGGPAVAGALLALAGSSVAPAGTAALDASSPSEVLDARISALTAARPVRQRAPWSVAALTVLGSLAAISIVACATSAAAMLAM